mmetsp:Transcript_47328/g.113580  ORF Transcript_47328/g.113580 Transcript_47328/m.113580 type:complete len:292 (+) Transcript_47328:566-1441(+)
MASASASECASVSPLTSLPSCSANGIVCASDIWFSSEDVGESWASASQSNVVGMAPGSSRSTTSSGRGNGHGAWCDSSEGPWPLVLGLQRMRLRSTPSWAIPIESSGASTGVGAGACEKNMLSTNERSSPKSASVRASRVSGEGNTVRCCGTLLSRASHKLMELRTPVRCLRTRGQLDEMPPPLLSPSPSTPTCFSDSVSTALGTAVKCDRPHVGSLIVCASTCSRAACMEVCSSQIVGASRFRVKAFFPLRFGGAVNAYARQARGTVGLAVTDSDPAIQLCPSPPLVLSP